MNRYRVGLSLALCLSCPAQALDVRRTTAAIDEHLDKSYPDLFRLYTDIHAHPELAFQETRTATLLASRMRKLGFEVTEQVGGTGVVAVARNGPGPTVLIRTELDALPMEEKTGLPYASRAYTIYMGQPTFVAHSCGHDIHMAAWIGTARTLMAMKARWRGTLMFVAQPAEETLSGAAAMIADGLFTRFPKPDYAFALHTGPYPAGQVLYRPGTLTSNADSIEISFRGRGGHGSSPHNAIDPVLIAARFVVDVQSVVSREKNPQQPGVVSIGAIQGGTAGNIIPDEVTVRGTIRSFDPAVRAALSAGVERVALAAASMAAAPQPDFKRAAGADSVVNDADLTERTAAVFREALGEAAVRRHDYLTASEDFSKYASAGGGRSLLFEIGIYDEAQTDASKRRGESLPFNHSPYYAPAPDGSIRFGVKTMTLTVLNVLGTD